MIPSISPAELHDELQGENPPTVIDVRESFEVEICFLDGSLHIPLAQLPSQIDGIDKHTKLVMLCKVGGRSAQATQYLLQRGFTDVRNLSTGINGWARSVDPTMSVY